MEGIKDLGNPPQSGPKLFHILLHVPKVIYYLQCLLPCLNYENDVSIDVILFTNASSRIFW